eukprot:CAMPEP_0194381238 /NCGR_PEP_ID=MMETSP0174-20130528/51581_1 /TAXON_ID=216777 /ORGANISM="Proboscia alata, Strain PI-D3" /LENGTH=49 /DNA_ID= /DNA_START= /DNA_END= /DNA_ORIENTATION=
MTPQLFKKELGGLGLELYTIRRPNKSVRSPPDARTSASGAQVSQALLRK